MPTPPLIRKVRFDVRPWGDRPDPIRELLPYIDKVSLVDLVSGFEHAARYDVPGSYAGIVLDHFDYGDLTAYLTGQPDYPQELTVTKVGATSRPLAEQVAAARAAHPQGTLVAVRPGASDATTQVDFALPELGDKSHTIYVDPYTGQVTGQLTTWYGTTPLKTWLDDLHRNLHLGAVGRHYSELAASWLWILALGGVILWWRRHRGARTARRLLAPDLAANKGVRRTRGWHAATGVWLTTGLLILSATGLTWSHYAGAHFSAALGAVRSGTPEVSTSLTTASIPAAGAHHHGGAEDSAATASVNPTAIDSVLAAARRDGLTGPVEIGVPKDTATAWTVSQTRNLWPVGRDSVAVAAATGTVVDRVNFADWPLLAKLTRWGINAHMGTLFGPVNQLLLAALALGLLCVIVWGYRMWWQRRPTRAARRAPVGTPPDRGTWRHLHPALLVAVLAGTAAIGWALPELGISLLAFLVIDAVAGLIQRRRRRTTTPTSLAPAGA